MRKCLRVFAVLLVAHVVLSVVSETYGGIVGGPVAFIIVNLIGLQDRGELKAFAIAHHVPIALTVEGIVLVSAGAVACRLRARNIGTR